MITLHPLGRPGVRRSPPSGTSEPRATSDLLCTTIERAMGPTRSSAPPTSSSRGAAATPAPSRAAGPNLRGRPPLHLGSKAANPVSLNAWITSRTWPSDAANISAIRAACGPAPSRHLGQVCRAVGPEWRSEAEPGWFRSTRRVQLPSTPSSSLMVRADNRFFERSPTADLSTIRSAKSSPLSARGDQYRTPVEPREFLDEAAMTATPSFEMRREDREESLVVIHDRTGGRRWPSDLRGARRSSRCPKTGEPGRAFSHGHLVHREQIRQQRLVPRPGRRRIVPDDLEPSIASRQLPPR